MKLVCIKTKFNGQCALTLFSSAASRVHGSKRKHGMYGRSHGPNVTVALPQDYTQYKKNVITPQELTAESLVRNFAN